MLLHTEGLLAACHGSSKPCLLVRPASVKPVCSLMWWALWLYFWGGAGFLGVGIFYYWQSPNGQQGSHVASFRVCTPTWLPASS